MKSTDMQQPIDILVADIGGTNCRFARYRVERPGVYQHIDASSVPTGKYASFQQLLSQVANSHASFDLERHSLAVFAVPGPVIHSTHASLTNVPWDIDIGHLSRNTATYLINDFEAQAFGCLAEEPGNFVSLKHPGQSMQTGMAVVGAGTGIGHCAIKRHGGKMIPLPSEAGQIPFPFQGEREYAYLRFVMDKLAGRTPNGDRIVSGQGLSLLHEYLTGQALTPREVAAGLDSKSETSRWFARFYGRLCRNYVLTLLPFIDILYISGGVAVKNPFLVNDRYFLEEFVASDTKAGELERVAIRLATNESLGLLGAAHYGVVQRFGEG